MHKQVQCTRTILITRFWIELETSSTSAFVEQIYIKFNND